MTATLAVRSVPVELPSLRDARLHVAACLLTVQVLGQVAIDWDLSIAQILVALLTAAALEVTIVLRQRGVLAWPASALLTGNGVALLLRVPGTEHGDWWSLRGWPIFAGCAAVSVLSKHLLRVDDRPLFNPSNLGLVLTFLVLGSARTEPQDFWWGPWSLGLALVYAVLLGGGIVITRRLGLLGLATSFWVTFAVAFGVVVATGHAITATWHLGPVAGAELWWIVVSSPELLVFLFFMITDPRTVPGARVPRLLFGAGVGALAVVLAAPQTTEFATKVAVLAALTVACVAWRLRWVLVPVVGAAVALTVVVAVAGPAKPAAGGFDPELRAAVEDVDGLVVPPLTVQPSADDLLEASMAPAIAEDLLAGLAIEADALARGDADLAAVATTAERLDAVEAAISDGDGRPARYEFDRLGLFVHRNLGAHQAAPRIGVVAHGTVEQDGAPTRDIHTVFTLEPVQGTWLVAGTAPLTDAPGALR